ncbi:hypothetical protein D9M68_691080 [compost metagenome]
MPTALDHPVTANEKGAGAGQGGQCAGHRVGEELGDLDLEQLAHIALPQPFQTTGFALLLAGGLDEFHRRQGFHEEGGYIRRTLAQAAHLALHLAPHPAQPEHFDGDEQRQQQGKLPGQQQHQRYRADQADDAGDGGEQ